MAITKLLQMKGEAEVLGALRVVSWDALEGAHIEGLTQDEFVRLLELVKTGAVQGVRMPEIRPPATSTGVAATPEENRASQARRSSEDRKPETQKAPSNVVQMPAPKDVVVPPKPEQVAALNAKAEKLEDPALEFPPKDAAPAEQTELQPAGDVPEKVLKSGRFVEVLDWVMKSKGLKVTQVDEIVAECEKLRPVIKVVERVRDMKDKVTSNLQAYAESGSASA